MRVPALCLVPALVAAAWAGLPGPDPDRLKRDLVFLTSPACAGRATGDNGQKVAAAFIAKRMQENGLKAFEGPGLGGDSPYHFSYGLSRNTVDTTASFLSVEGKRLQLGQDFLAFVTEGQEAEAVLVGYGIKAAELGWDDYQNVDLKGKWAVILPGQPSQKEGPFNTNRHHPAASPEAKQKALLESGALGLIVLRSNAPKVDAEGSPLRPRLRMEGTGRPPSRSVRIDLFPVGQKALGLEVKRLKRSLEASAQPPAPRSLGTWKLTWVTGKEPVEASNLIGFIPGTDPKLKEEVVVLSAHHDHLGTHDGKTWPGADDNASGTAGILEVGRLLAQAGPRRSILVLSVSGEEDGLFGSASFLAHPPLDLTRVVANLNLDMIGRGAPEELHVTPAHVEGAVSTLTDDARRLASSQGLALQDGAEEYWRRSDHYNFVLKGIPSLFFFAGMHSDYHQPSDTPDKINFKKLGRVVALTRDLVLQVANAPERPKVLPKEVHQAWTWPSPVATPR